MISYEGIPMPICQVPSLFSFTFEELITNIYQEQYNKLLQKENVYFFHAALHEFNDDFQDMSYTSAIQFGICLYLAHQMQQKSYWFCKWNGYIQCEVPFSFARKTKKLFGLSSKYSALVWHAKQCMLGPEMCALLISTIHICPSDAFAIVGYQIPELTPE